MGATCQQRLYSADDPGLGIFSSTCRVRVRICPERHQASSPAALKDGSEILTPTLKVEGSSPPALHGVGKAQGSHARAHVGCLRLYAPGDGQEITIGVVRAGAHVAARRLALCVCQRKTPKSQRDRPPPDSYLLVLVSPVRRQTPRLSPSPQITPGGPRVKVNTPRLRKNAQSLFVLSSPAVAQIVPRASRLHGGCNRACFSCACRYTVLPPCIDEEQGARVSGCLHSKNTRKKMKMNSPVEMTKLTRIYFFM